MDTVKRQPVPDDVQHIRPLTDSLLDPALIQNIQQNKGLSGYYTLSDAELAIAVRLNLIQEARHSIDVQYYIWSNDSIGLMLLTALQAAAERGVTVRILIDDNNGSALDDVLRALAKHPNINIRLFNPFSHRHMRVLDYLFHFNRSNHRMHNKLLQVDQQLTVLGGRNISNEYFDAGASYQFSDLDVLLIGDVNQQTKHAFERYWNNEEAFPIQQLVQPKTNFDLKKALTEKQPYPLHRSLEAISQTASTLKDWLNTQQAEWVKAEIFVDPPSKIKSNVDKKDFLIHRLQSQFLDRAQRLNLVSAYFVPTDLGTQQITAKARKDTPIYIITNSFRANDVGIVHAYYQKYRKQLIQSGVQLYEFKPLINKEPTWYEKLTANIVSSRRQQNSRLHAKFSASSKEAFIGSFNFDPRSAVLNTEIGVLLHSTQLATQIHQSLTAHVQHTAYQLTLNDQHQLVWLETLDDGSTVQHLTEPHTNRFERLVLRCIGALPFEWMV